jgi:ribosomal protein L37AE/L43A
MKQEILCPDCALMKEKRYPTKNPYPGEHIKFVEGKAQREFKCDYCDKKIETGDEATAFSIWADHGKIPYYKWEHNFLQL